MLRIAFRFTSGRYHATPWGRHVNEGAIEWPPSPWRFYRALLSTGWSRHGWDAVPSEAHQLLAAICHVVPTYFVEPSTGAGHTRHYMPKFKGSTDRVIDAFMVVPSDRSSVVIEWDVVLTESTRTMLDELLASLPYLGRAESLVEAAVLDSIPGGLVRCAPGPSAPSMEYQRLDLLAPLAADDLVTWRMAMLAAA
ncbi:MAG: type I-U CRISPR-associated protein Csb2, partial [Proteobacteria bacterium]|nr:type I-U CRISPR-associated protein Csb2 [Pseudomonadota bacterium]